MYLRYPTYPLVPIIALCALVLAWSAVGPAMAGGFVEPRGARVFSNEHHLGYGLAPHPCGPAFFRPDGAALAPYPPAGPPADLPDPTLQGLGVGLDLKASARRRHAPHNMRRRGKHRDRVYVGSFWAPLDGGPVELNGLPIERECP